MVKLGLMGADAGLLDLTTNPTGTHRCDEHDYISRGGEFGGCVNKRKEFSPSFPRL